MSEGQKLEICGTIRLFSEGLLSKWGFRDGDILWDQLYDWQDAGLIGDWSNLDDAKILNRVVREFLVPALDQKVEVYDIGTIHNPIRAQSVDGVKVGEEIYDPDQTRFTLTPDCVEVPLSRVLEITIEELANNDQ